ncbi:MAG TPA: type II secretion system F family protein, partial [Longimicrobiales bacterium]|nr:type II secretion system F family protein [Longimicrobiales bacterium]
MSTKFRYRAATDRGEVVEGVSDSVSRDELLEELRGRELYALSVEETGAPSRAERRWGREAAVTRWARSFATLVGAGTPLDRALDVSARHAGHEAMTAVVLSVRDGVRGGASLSEALARHPRWFPDVVPAMARAGEASGAMGEVFEEVADYLEEVAELRAQVRSAMIYPALMATVAALGVAVLLLFVVPRFADILADLGGSMPLTTRMLIASGTFLGRFWWLVLGVLAGGVTAWGVWVRRPGNRQRWHHARLAVPKLGDLELQLLSARF